VTDDEARIEDLNIGELCLTFVHDIESLAETLPLLMQVLTTAHKDLSQKMNKFIDTYGTTIQETDDVREYSIDINKKPAHDKLQRKLAIFGEAIDVTPKSFLVSLVSAYDAYLGRLIKALYYKKPELLNASERALTFSQLIELKTLSAAQEFIVEKEVETVLRKSHAQQFDWLEKTFSVPLRKGLVCWPYFIEVTERRNLFVHADGVVNSQYGRVCSEHGFIIPAVITPGVYLGVTPQYFETASNCLAEIGLKLAHVLWRKLEPDSLDKADNNLVEVIYDYLVKKNYRMAGELSDFALTVLKRYASDETRRTFVISFCCG
jgi:hypothetical protein